MNKKVGGVLLFVLLIATYYFLSAPQYNPQYPHEEHTRGPANASATVIEFSDFQCSACQVAFPEVEQFLLENNTTRFVYKHFPLTQIHPRAFRAAQASECAADQGKFWEFYKEVFTTRALTDKDFTLFAKKIGIDSENFMRCLKSGVMADRVRQDIAEAALQSVRATPTFIINGNKHEGIIPAQKLAALAGRTQ